MAKQPAQTETEVHPALMSLEQINKDELKKGGMRELGGELFKLPINKAIRGKFLGKTGEFVGKNGAMATVSRLRVANGDILRIRGTAPLETQLPQCTKGDDIVVAR